MAEPELVGQCVAAMRDAVALPVTVKHRIGIDRTEDYGFVRDFVGTIAQAGCSVFIVHARNAWLKGLSPKENREVPPLRYAVVHRLRHEFPGLTFVINGGLADDTQIDEQLAQVDGAMIGRHAYHHPWAMTAWDRRFFGEPAPEPRRAQVEDAMVAYMERQRATRGEPWPRIARHMMGLWNGTPGARRWRQVWSDHRLKDRPPREVQRLAAAALQQGLSETSTA
jgi:tRNA-dihydrouridine synthase A